MLRDKGYTKSLVLSTIFLLIFIYVKNTYCQDEEFAISLKSKLKKINEQFASSVIKINNTLAVAIEKNYAIIPFSEAEKNSTVALDSKLNLAIVKTEKPLNPVRFELPRKQTDIFFLITDNSVSVVNGSWKDNTVEIFGKQPLGSLVVSVDLTPLAVVVKADYISEAILIKPVYNDIVKLIKRAHGWLGIQGQSITKDLSKIFGINEGIVITNIYEGGPADKAGLMRGDVIVMADNYSITELKDLQSVVASKFAGDTLKVKFLRDGSTKETLIILEEPPKEIIPIKAYSVDIKGVLVEEIPETVKLSIRKSVKGVFIKKIDEDSPALGILKEGDIIVEINKKTISKISEYYDALREAESRDLLILIYRKDNFQYVIVPASAIH